MARLMRLCVLGFGLALATGCAAAPVAPPRPTPHPAAAKHYVKAKALSRSLTQRTDRELLEKEASRQVLELARAQTCVARYTNTPALAEHTVEMLDAYLALHEDHGQKPTALFRVRANQAKRDARSAGRGYISPRSLGCVPGGPVYRSSGPPGWGTGTTRYTQNDYYGTGLPWNQFSRSVPGGVIR